jgi:MFS family permease
VSSPTLADRPGARPRAGARPGAMVLLVCCFSTFMAQIDATAVNVALPAMGRDLGGGLAASQWVVDGYVLALACLAVTGGGLGDRFGRRKVYRVGLTVFTCGSLACAAAHTFDDPTARSRAIGLWAGASGLAAAAGPLLGGGLVTAAGWRSIFWVNVPIGALALFLTRRYVPESRAAQPRPFDAAGQTLWVLATAILTYALIHAPSSGWLSGTSVLLFGAAVCAALGLVVVESRSAHPLIDPRLYRDRVFAGVSVLAVLFFLAVNGTLFISSLILQRVHGLSPVQTGLRLLPAPAALALGAMVSGRLAPRAGNRPILLSATTALSAACLLLALTGDGTSPALSEPAYLLLGSGLGLANPLLTDIAIAAMPRSRAGVASATVGTSRQLGSVLGVAIMGSLAAHGSQTARLAKHAELTLDPRPAYLAATAVALVALCTAVAGAPRRTTDDHPLTSRRSAC